MGPEAAISARKRAQAAKFSREFPAPEFYVSTEAARQAAASCGQFNIIHPESGLKVDVIIPADTPFNRSRLARATRWQRCSTIQGISHQRMAD